MSETNTDSQTLEEAIRKNAAGPKSAEVDGQKVEQHPIGDVIEADRYLAARKASKSRGFGLRFAKISHPGV